MFIKVEFSSESLWGNFGSDGYVPGASEDKFAELLSERIAQELTGSDEIEVEHGSNDKITVSDVEAEDFTRQWVSELIHEVYTDYDWLIEA